jgi:Transposase DDE domain
MASIRKTKTGSGATAVQVVRYTHRRIEVLKHIGSGHSEEEVKALVESAQAWLRSATEQPSLFPTTEPRTFSLDATEYLGARRGLLYEVLRTISDRCGFSALGDRVLEDLAIMRLVEPASKLRSLALLGEYFGVEHARRTVTRSLRGMEQHKAQAEGIAVAFAKEHLRDGLRLVLYDVTTLYFESFEADALRVPGFSKDNKPQQPQIVVGLLVTSEGFPLGYEVFPGNTFEGKTMLPVLDAFVAAHGVKEPVVVADAAMLSAALFALLKEKGLSYIVGARLSGAGREVIDRVSKGLAGQDGALLRVPTAHGDLICSFSFKRYAKDKSTLDKQVEKAQELVRKGEPGRRAKFVKATQGKEGYALDEQQLAKATGLLGIKGYYTNLPRKKMSDAQVVAHYHGLWHVEKAFRMAKSDLAARPIFHHREHAVRAHLLICFIALTIGTSMELATGLSMRNMTDQLRRVTDAQFRLKTTGEMFRMRTKIPDNTSELLRKLKVPY